MVADREECCCNNGDDGESGGTVVCCDGKKVTCTYRDDDVKNPKTSEPLSDKAKKINKKKAYKKAADDWDKDHN